VIEISFGTVLVGDYYSKNYFSFLSAWHAVVIVLFGSSLKVVDNPNKFSRSN
jgi:hypothetical protein